MHHYQTIEYQQSGPISTIWFNRPEVRNGFNQKMIEEVSDCLKIVEADKYIRVLIFRGKGKVFSSGADLNWLRDVASYSFERNYTESQFLAACFHAIYSCSKPTISVVHGAAIGGANGFMAACDFVICEENTVFSLSEVKIGILPACISPYIKKRVGEFASNELMLSGKRFNGSEAEMIGLVNKSVHEDKIEQELEVIVKQLLTSGPNAISACKKLIYEISNNRSFEESIDHTARLIAELRASAEGQEGMASFLEKRKPDWV